MVVVIRVVIAKIIVTVKADIVAAARKSGTKPPKAMYEFEVESIGSASRFI